MKNEESYTNLPHDENFNQEKLQGPRFGKRHIQMINICFLIFVAYYARNSLSVAIVAMNDRNSTSNQEIPTFNWTNKNIILSSFFIGYVPLQVIIGFFIVRMRIKILAVTAITLCSILGLLTPVVAEWAEANGMIAIRVLQGLTQAFTFPLSQHLTGQWVPPNERATLIGAVFAARPIATVVSMSVPGYIAASSYGWPWIFYSSNLLSLLWCISFILFSYEKPSTHPTISIKEKNYIEKSLGVTNILKKRSTPVRAILTSVPFWAQTMAHLSNVWCFWTLQSQMPMYLKYVMKYNIQMSGFLSALPYLLQGLLAYFFCFISDYLLNRNVWSINTARKVMNSIAFFISALCLILIQSSGLQESTKAIVLLNIALAINGACFCGYMVNINDLSPNYSGFLMGVCNGLSQICGLLAPLFAQAVVKDETDPNDWKYIFYTTAAFFIAGGLIFIFFGTAEVQPWNSYGDKKEEQDENLNPVKEP